MLFNTLTSPTSILFSLSSSTPTPREKQTSVLGSSFTEYGHTQEGLLSERSPEQGPGKQGALGEGPGTKKTNCLVSEHT